MPAARLVSPLAMLALLVLGSDAASAQESLYMPRGVAKAYRNGTRAKDGRPGPKY